MRGLKGGGPDPISPSENSNFLKLHSKITKNIHWTPSPSPKQT